MSIQGINPTGGPKPTQSVTPAAGAEEKSTAGGKFDVGGSQKPQTPDVAPAGPEVSQVTHQMTQTIRDGVAAGEDRSTIFNRVVNQQIDAEVGTHVSPQVREQAVEIMSSHPVLREMYDRLFTQAVQQQQS
ncbi:MAG: hypothetical protein AAF797_18070 [Planctomycetota bacterium]